MVTLNPIYIGFTTHTDKHTRKHSKDDKMGEAFNTVMQLKHAETTMIQLTTLLKVTFPNTNVNLWENYRDIQK